MGFAHRLRTGLGDLISGGNQVSTGRLHDSRSMNVNAVKYAAELSQFHEAGGFSQPVFGAELSTVGSYEREGYTSRTFDTPTVPFKTQVYYAERDEDVSLAVNDLSSKITGGAHYWKSEVEAVTDKMSQFTKDIDFDWIDTILVKEVITYGNSFWKARLGINQIRNKDDLMNIPISSCARIWWDRQRMPYKYEFRGSEYQGYFNAANIMHFLWNPINASLFGTGVMTSLCSTRDFEEITPSGQVSKKLPSLMDRKYSTAMTMHLTERRYTPHNVYVAMNASQTERAQLTADLGNLDTGEDIVVGNKVEVQELGTAARAFDPTMFTNMVQGEILKGLQTFTGKQGGEESHQYANAEESSAQTEIGLASFPLAITRQLQNKLFQPWYDQTGGAYDDTLDMYGMPIGINGGMAPVAWNQANPEVNFGSDVKVELDTEQQIKLVELAISTGAVQDPVEMRQLMEDAGLNLRKEMTDQMQQQYNPMQPQPMVPMVGQAPPPMPDFSTYGADHGARPNSDPNYDSSYRDQSQSEPQNSMDASPSVTNSWDPQPSDPRLNWTEQQISKRLKVDTSLPAKLAKSKPTITSKLKDPKVPAFKNLHISDINALLSQTEQ